MPMFVVQFGQDLLGVVIGQYFIPEIPSPGQPGHDFAGRSRTSWPSWTPGRFLRLEVFRHLDVGQSSLKVEKPGGKACPVLHSNQFANHEAVQNEIGGPSA